MSLSFTIMEEMIIVPKKELPEVVQWYKSELTGNALLERAGRLSAQEKRLLEDPLLDADEAVQKVRPLSQALRTATKRLRQFPVGGVGEPPIEGQGEEDEQDQELVSSAVEKWMKRMVQSVTPRAKTERRTLPKPRLPPKLNHKQHLNPQKFPDSKGIYPLHHHPHPPPQETEVRPKTTLKKKSWTSAALEGSLEGIKSSLTPRALKRLKAPPGWEDWEQGKKLRRGQLAGSDSKIVEQDGPRISLASTSVHGTRNAFEKTIDTWRSWHQSSGQDRQNTRYGIFEHQDVEGQA